MHNPSSPGENPSAAHRAIRCAAAVFPRGTGGVRRGCRLSRQRGFTLVELLLIAIVLSVLAAIAAPRYAGALTHYRADSAARRIATDLDAARATSRAQSTTVTVTFSADGYTISHVQPFQTAVLGTYTVNLRQDPYGVKGIAADFGGGSSLSFDGYGQTSIGGTVTVRVGHAERVVVVDAATSTARVKR